MLSAQVRNAAENGLSQFEACLGRLLRAVVETQHAASSPCTIDSPCSSALPSASHRRSMLRLYQSRRDQGLQNHRRWEIQKVLSPKPIPNPLRTDCDCAVNGW